MTANVATNCNVSQWNDDASPVAASYCDYVRTFSVYILASHSRRLYVGVTSDLLRRTYEHKNELVTGFAERHRATRLVYFESTADPHAAINREKQIKRWPRSRKYWLIERANAGWLDLAEDWYR